MNKCNLWENVDSKEEIEEAIEKRGETNSWYVLHFDVKNADYLNEIEFKSYSEAVEQFEKETPINDNDRVELIFSPEETDNEFSDNIILKTKKNRKGENN